jgi:radical SAM superfamily enzyme YgiQ (UPF0313 family)
MRVLLTLPPGRTHYRVPPLGLLYIAGTLRKAGHDVFLHDPTVRNGGIPGIARAALDVAPDLVGVSSHSHETSLAFRVADALLGAVPGAVRILGGPHVSADPGVIGRSHGRFHYGVAGEGEQPIADLVRVLEDGRDPRGIAGVVNGDSSQECPGTRWTAADLDALPEPAWDLAPPGAYRGAPQGFFFERLPVAPILTSRGCPFGCTFCGGRAVMGRRLRHRSRESVMAEVGRLVRDHGARELHILDDTFTTARARALDLLHSLEPLGLSMAFPNGLRADTLDDEMAVALRRAGTHSVSLGIESGSPEILERVDKSLSLDSVRRAVTALRRVGIRVGGFFILGFPGETEADIQATIRFALELPLDRAHFSSFLPLPGTPARLEMERAGEPVPDDRALAYDAVPYAPAEIGRPRLKALQRQAFLRFYLRPRPMFSLVSSIRSPAHLSAALSRASGYLGGGQSHA